MTGRFLFHEILLDFLVLNGIDFKVQVSWCWCSLIISMLVHFKSTLLYCFPLVPPANVMFLFWHVGGVILALSRGLSHDTSSRLSRSLLNRDSYVATAISNFFS